MCLWRLEDSSVKSILSYHLNMGPGMGLRSPCLLSKCFTL